MAHLIVRRRAREDVIDLAARIALDKLEPALRFIDAAEKAFTFLWEHPNAGPKIDPPIPASPQLRFWPIRRFRNYLVIYQPLENGVEIIRVLHRAPRSGKRDETVIVPRQTRISVLPNLNGRRTTAAAARTRSGSHAFPSVVRAESYRSSLSPRPAPARRPRTALHR